MNRIKFSVVIITYNEEELIGKCIDNIKASNLDVEIVVSDGGSNDNTISILKEKNVIIQNGVLGRGKQFNKGFLETTGDVILFLHGDTILPSNTFQILQKYFENLNVKIGTFRLAFDKNNLLLKLYCKLTKFDSIFTRFGDQCIVVRKSFFEEIGKFPEWKLFEDVELLKRARKKTKIYSFPSSVITSARRFKENGLIKQQLKNAKFMIMFFFGVSHENLSRKYNSLRKKEELQKKLSLPKIKTLQIPQVEE